MDQIRVIVVDDDHIVTDTLERYFATTEDIVTVGTASNGSEALDVLHSTLADVIVADIHMPGMDGVQLLRAMKRMSHPPTFVAMTSLDSDEIMLEVLSHGAAAYIIKSAEASFIIETVRQAAHGGTVVSPEPMSRLVGYLPTTHVAPPLVAEDLPEAQRLILDLLCDGLSNSEIAEKSGYSESTVKKQVSTLIAHFGARSRLNLVVKALRSGFGG